MPATTEDEHATERSPMLGVITTTNTTTTTAGAAGTAASTSAPMDMDAPTATTTATTTGAGGAATVGGTSAGRAGPAAVPLTAAAAAAAGAVAAAAAAASPPPVSAIKVTPQLAEELTNAINVHIMARNARNHVQQSTVTVFSSWKPKKAKQTELYEVVARLLPAVQVKNAAGKTTALRMPNTDAVESYSIDQLQKMVDKLLPDTCIAKTASDFQTVVASVLATAQQQMEQARSAASAGAAAAVSPVAAMTREETALIGELNQMEGLKKVAKDKHPPFTKVDSLRVDKLSTAQLKAVSKYCMDKRGMQKPVKLTKAHMQDAIRGKLPPNPVAQLEMAVDIASQLVAEFATNYFNQMATLIRQVNEQFGTFSRDWKVWWVYNGLMRMPAHCKDDHTECGRFVPYTRCIKGKFAYIPSWRYWTDYDAKGYPPGVAEAATLLMDGWTFGSYMADLLPSIIMYANTSAAESYFHGLDVWLPMWSHFTPWGFKLGQEAWHLTFNEQKVRKELTSGIIKKTKTHKERGILVAEQKRSRIKLWALGVLEKVFAEKHVGKWAKARREYAERQVVRRHKHVVRYEEKKTKMLDAHLADPTLISAEALPNSVVNRAPEHTRLKRMRLSAGADMGLGYLPVDCQASTEPQQIPFPFRAGKAVCSPELQAAAAAVMAGAEPRESAVADSPIDVDQAVEFQLPAVAANDTIDESVAADEPDTEQSEPLAEPTDQPRRSSRRDQ